MLCSLKLFVWVVTIVAVINDPLLGLGCAEAKAFDIRAELIAFLVLACFRSINL